MSRSTFPFVRSGPEALFRMDSWTHGPESLTSSMPIGPWLDGPRGPATAGALGVLADDVTGYLLATTRPPGGWSVSAEITLDVLRPLPVGGEVHATGSIVHLDGIGGFSTAAVTDDAGGLVARVTQRGRYVDAPGLQPVARPFTEPAGASDVVPWLVEGFVGPGPRAVPDVLGNPLGNVHGGISLALAALNAESVAAAHLEVASVHIVYSRGIPVGADLAYRTSVLHQGRNMMVVAVVAEVEQRPATLSQVVLQPRRRERD